MKGNTSEDDSGIVAEINMIPLIDVSLVLLIIFMVMTPILIQSQIKVNLPEAGTAESASDQDTIRVLVTENGEIYIDDQPVATEELTSTLTQKALVPAEATLVVEADRVADFGHVVRALDAAKGVGIHKIGVAVKEKTGGTRSN